MKRYEASDLRLESEGRATRFWEHVYLASEVDARIAMQQQYIAELEKALQRCVAAIDRCRNPYASSTAYIELEDAANAARTL